MLRSAQKRSVRLGGFAAAAVAALIALTSCSSGGPSEPAANDGSIVVTGAALPATFAFDAGGGGSYEIIEFIINNGATLLRYPYVENENGVLAQDYSSYEGVLAESYELSEDGLTYTFTLRDGVVSQAGNPLTSEDVRWTFERKFNNPGTSVKAIMAPALIDLDSQFTIIDDTRFSITIPEAGYGFTFLGNLTVLISQIYDSTLLKEMETPEDPYAIEWTRANANFGFGAYNLERFTPGEEMTLTANPDYVLGEAEAKRIVYRVSAEPGTRATLLRNGDVDIAEELLPADQVQLADEGIIELQDVTTNNLNALQLVANKAPFDDVAVRQAFDYAVPYEQIIENVYRGRAQRQVGLLPADLPNLDDTGLDAHAYEAERAKKMLADAGYPDGVEFTLSVSNAVPDLQETAVQIQSFAADAGFTVNIAEVAPAAILAGRRDGTFQSYLLRQQLMNLAPSYVLSLWFKEEPTSNVSQWFDADYRAVVETGGLVADQLSVEANEYWYAAQKTLVEQSPVLPIAVVDPLSGFGPAVEGYAWRTDNVLDYSQITFID